MDDIVDILQRTIETYPILDVSMSLNFDGQGIVSIKPSHLIFKEPLKELSSSLQIDSWMGLHGAVLSQQSDSFTARIFFRGGIEDFKRIVKSRLPLDIDELCECLETVKQGS